MDKANTQIILMTILRMGVGYTITHVINYRIYHNIYHI